jgi:membrane protein required for colicin V production
LTWPDLIVLGVIFITTLWGFKNGMVQELSGFVALGTAIWFAAAYKGAWDAWIVDTTNLAPAAGHAAGVALVAVFAYGVVSACMALLRRIARLPVIGLFDGILGAGFGALKGIVLSWAAIYVALFFPLTHQVRADLAVSKVVDLLLLPDNSIDAIVKANLPSFAQEEAAPIFKRHRLEP